MPISPSDSNLIVHYELAPGLSPVVPVSLLVATARLAIERQLPLMWVSGEVSNFTRAASGHCYFSLKDEVAQVRCVLFRHKAQLQDVTLRNGMHVELRAAATIYEARGEFQLNVEAVRLAGVGRLYEAFNRLKAELERRGWFAAERKRALPPLPRRIGIVTSPTGAAIRDVVTTLARRFPSIPVVVYPAPVQGAGASARIASAIREANRRAECDVLIVCRGGGSIEDLWAFNEEAVARAVFDSVIPVVSGVGHETDFTICDFVADTRAATPTAAATLVVPDVQALRAQARALAGRLRRAIVGLLERRMQRVDDAARRLRHPSERLRAQSAELVHLARRLHALAWRRLERDEDRFARSRERLARLLATPLPQRASPERLASRLVGACGAHIARGERRVEIAASRLSLLDPRGVLKRGYALVTDPAGQLVSTATQLRVGQSVRIEFERDRAEARVLATSTAGDRDDAFDADAGGTDVGARSGERES